MSDEEDLIAAIDELGAFAFAPSRTETRYIKPSAKRGSYDRTYSAQHDQDELRKRCQEGTDRYRAALKKAGHLKAKAEA
jgi:hypothetical protein